MLTKLSLRFELQACTYNQVAVGSYDLFTGCIDGVACTYNQVAVGSYDLFTGCIDGVDNILVKNLECCFLRQIN